VSDVARAFYGEELPTQFNRLLDREIASRGPDDALCRGLRAVDETLAVRIEQPDDDARDFFLNISAGRMSAGTRPARPPFLTLVHDAGALPALRAEAGDSAPGFLAGMAGLGGEMRLTRQRVEALKEIEGSIRLSLLGGDGFSLLGHFGAGPIPAQPDCALVVSEDVYRELRAARIDAQEAFMSGGIDVEGDLQIAMRLAVAVLSAD